jgi:hypothetical protein
MKNKLPNVFANPFDKKINNVQEVYKTKSIVEEDRVINKYEDIETKIRKIFNSPNYVYKSNVIITTDEGISEKTIVGRTKNSLLTTTNELIDVSKIKDIKTKD